MKLKQYWPPRARSPRFQSRSHFGSESRRFLRWLFGLAAVILFATTGWAEDTTRLPELGGSGPALFSSQQEAEIGNQVLQQIRQSGALLNDPLTLDFLHNVLYRLVPYAPLDNRDITTILIDDPSVNAFAVPGGIIGVNGGLFLHAATEQEFGAVLAHELGHLAQHHFERRLERQKQSAPWTLAGIISGFILSAVTHSDAGMAAAAGTEAWSVQNMLHYSRMDEQEADRIGLQIMADAGLNPRAMPRMFEELLRESRIQGSQPPEFLMDHPVTESRIADTRNRADQYPRRKYPESLEYQLMRARMVVHFSRSPDAAVKQFQSLLDDADGGNSDEIQSRKYGLAVALIRSEKPQKAIPVLQHLLGSNPDRITYVVTLAEAHLKAGEPAKAQDALMQCLNLNPGNYPVMQALAKADLALEQPDDAARILEHLSQRRPQDASIWQSLAEADGQARDIVGVHRARAEYQFLMGHPDAAVMQLRQALNKVTNNAPLKEIIQQRLNQIQRYQRHHQDRG